METTQAGETRRPGRVATIRRRTTTRKALIEKVLAEDYAGGPVLLEELRWKVSIQQYGPSFVEMTDAKQKSFARTIREHFPQLSIEKAGLAFAPGGAIARAALYRISLRSTIERFLTAHHKHVCLNIGFPDHHDYNAHRRRVTIGCFFLTHGIHHFSRFGIQCEEPIATIILPKSQSLTAVQSVSARSSNSFDSISNVDWKLHFPNNHVDGGLITWVHDLGPLDRMPFWRKKN